MALIISIAMLTSVSRGQDQTVSSGFEPIDLGTDCEYQAYLRSWANVYGDQSNDAASPHDATGECFDPRVSRRGDDVQTKEFSNSSAFDLLRGRGVEFYSTSWSNTSPTFRFYIECRRMCSIVEVSVSGTGWCGGDIGWSRLQLYSDVQFSTVLAGTYAEALVPKDWTADTYGTLTINNESNSNYAAGGVLGSGTPFATGFTIIQVGDDVLDGSSQARCPEVSREWRCRNSLRLLVRPLPPTIGDHETIMPPQCAGDCSGWTGAGSSADTTTTSSTSTTSTTPSIFTWPTEDSREGSSVDSSDDSSDDSKDSSSAVSSDDSSSESSADSGDQPTHCHSDEECRSNEICDQSECVDDPSGDSKDSSSRDSKGSSSGDSKDSSSSSDSRSKGSSKADSEDSSGADSKGNSSSDSSDDSGLAACEALPIDTVLSKCSSSMACEARLRECEMRQDLFLSMTGEESSGEEKVAPLPAPATFGAEEALIGFLVVANVALLAYVCVCKGDVAKNKPVYGGAHSSEQADLCA